MAVNRAIALSLDHLIPPATRAAAAAQLARKTRDELIAKGEAPPFYQTFVDGHEGAAEETVRLDGGAILYRFNVLGLAATFALEYARRRSPEQSGEYRDSWVVFVDGQVWGKEFDRIPADATVILTNHAPYHRRIDTGGQRGIGRKIVEDTRQAVMARWGGVLDVARQFVEIPGGYILKGRARARGKRRLRASQRAGAAMQYPAIVMKARR